MVPNNSEDDDDDSKTVKEEDLAFDRGMRKEVKSLYREDYRHPWAEWTPDNDKMDAERLKNSKFAVVGRWEMDTDSDGGLALHSITVQSPILKKLLETVFKGYKGVETKMKMKELTFSKPFNEFYYRWEQYQELCQHESERDEVAKEHISLLNSIVEPEIQPHVEHAKELKEEGSVTFDYLWVLFPPDCEIFAQIDRQDRILRLASSTYLRTQCGIVFQLKAKYITYDGTDFGWASETFQINAFEGYRKVLELSVVPLSAFQDDMKTQLVKRVEDRGRAFESLKGWHYLSYNGSVDPADEKLRKQKVYNGRVVIDADLYHSQDIDEDVVLEPLHSLSNTFDKTITKSMDDPFADLNFIPPPLPDPFAFLPGFGGQRKKKNNKDDDGKERQVELNNEHYRFCDASVKGYCLTSKQWVKMLVDNVDEIKWNTASFKRLVLPSDYKELILAFVDSHLSQGDSFDDIVQGKGRGIVILLSGVPGVGKTLTAEAVAEEMKKPLYSMSAGQLGFDADTVEIRLRSVLEICTKWRAVLLIDECDVFLEQRQISDIHRNKLVAVFLRLLEYYQGCMFLTTNRVATFDLAFKSRIDLIIDYPKLTPSAKKQIWQTFVKPSEEFPRNDSTITEEELDVLAKIDINGREIKNLVKTGRLLAKRKGEVLGMQHLRTVLGVQTGGPAIEDTEEVYPPLD
ncbi:hypothetical protein M409DRAFT_71347 [Zasmidium cellare ATCC 36951]|uniref:AAA+ ATPase domain-containing protein n=1 Tax=Zasmidium cellare ATCC 36951 TaxID=1080233 RepID=A0A6A6BWE0_ZASCE|nr:uncharacterized protein M409DRAFT_71347 [Zasmidium cellare ATCC 36951]KAF2159005.1 hypothetical protein M409DRAFT_71347 [Zasmidium cellare ATCC 36951]